MDKSRLFSLSEADTLNSYMNLFDANSIVTDLGLIGILAILFAETGLLLGLAFPGDSLLFVAGIAASGTGAALLNGNQLPTLELFIAAPIAAIIGMASSWLGKSVYEKFKIKVEILFVLKPIYYSKKQGMTQSKEPG